MVLSDSQIERYSRQIIVPEVGGGAQERLLASCVAIVAEPADAAAALAYLAGAGVGRIVIYPVVPIIPIIGRASDDAMIERMRDLNPDVNVSIADDAISADCDLMLALVGDVPAAEAAARLWRGLRAGASCAPARSPRAAILARLDAPGRIATMPAPPPCVLCAECDLLSPPGVRGANAGAIAMVAVTEAFKLLAGFAGQQPEAQLIEFDGYAARPRAFYRRRRTGDGGKTRCVCETLS